MKKTLFLMALLGAILGGLGAQTAPTDPKTPVPYDPSEFTQTEHDIRRFEVVMFGSLPFSWLVSSILYDVGRYVYKLSANDPNAANYAPLFFAGVNKPALTNDEIVGISVSSLGVSVLVAIADRLILDSQAQERQRNDAKFVPSTESTEAPAQEGLWFLGVDLGKIAPSFWEY